MGVLDRITSLGIVPVIELPSVAQAAPLVEALVAGGVDAAEFTLRTEAGLGAIQLLRDAYPEVLVGAGTVRTTDELRRVVDAGAQFVVSPATNPELISLCQSLAVVVLPGACTPTDVDTASRAGASAVKFFPAEAMGGIAMLKALAAPFRDVRFVPTGGINAANLGEYLRLPQVLACGGSWIVAPSLLVDGRFDEIETRSRMACAIVAEVRGG